MFVFLEVWDVLSTYTLIKSLLSMKHKMSEYIEMPNLRDLFHHLHVKICSPHLSFYEETLSNISVVQVYNNLSAQHCVHAF
jgi:hypothetical protein